MSRLMIAVLVGSSLGFAGSGLAQTASPAPMSKENHTRAMKDADAQYKSAKSACAALSGNAKDICAAEAKGKHNVAKSETEAAYKHTPKARESARVSQAQATYDVAIQRCDDLAGNAKDVCVKEAKAALVKGKSDAKVDRVAADTNKEAATTQAEARKDASADKRDAEYEVAIEKCDAFVGAAKDACLSAAKSRYDKS